MNWLDIPFKKLFSLFPRFDSPLGGHSGAKAGIQWKKHGIFDYFVGIKSNNIYTEFRHF